MIFSRNAARAKCHGERDKIAKQAEFDVAHSQDVVNKAWWGFNDMSARYPRRSLLF